MTTSASASASARVNDLVVTPEMVEEAGVISYWKLNGPVALDKLTAAWGKLGLDPKSLPAAPAPETALRRAVAELGGRRRLIRPLAKRGAWAIVDERVHGEKHLDYTEVARVFWKNNGIDFELADFDLRHKIRGAFDRTRDELAGEDVSTWLVRRAEAVQAVSLRDAGGVYFIPRQHADYWRKVAMAVEIASKDHHVYKIPAMNNADAVAAILDAVTTEAAAATKAMQAELAKVGEEALGKRALNSRGSACVRLLAKIETYEGLLGIRMDAIKTNVESLRADVASAALLAQAEADAE